jgi:hypothetical protein
MRTGEAPDATAVGGSLSMTQAAGDLYKEKAYDGISRQALGNGESDFSRADRADNTAFAIVSCIRSQAGDNLIFASGISLPACVLLESE